jgi:hypothetical protein
LSEQTQRDPIYLEIEETVIVRNPDGTLHLGSKVSELVKEQKHTKREEYLEKVHLYIAHHQGCEVMDIMSALNMSKNNFLALCEESGIIQKTGKGVKGDPFRYFISGLEPTDVKGAEEGRATETGESATALCVGAA